MPRPRAAASTPVPAHSPPRSRTTVCTHGRRGRRRVCCPRLGPGTPQGQGSGASRRTARAHRRRRGEAGERWATHLRTTCGPRTSHAQSPAPRGRRAQHVLPFALRAGARERVVAHFVDTGAYRDVAVLGRRFLQCLAMSTYTRMHGRPIDRRGAMRRGGRGDSRRPRAQRRARALSRSHVAVLPEDSDGPDEFRYARRSERGEEDEEDEVMECAGGELQASGMSIYFTCSTTWSYQ